MKKVFVVLVNYGSEQLHYLTKVINELKSFKNYEVTIHLVSNIFIDDYRIDKLHIYDDLLDFNYLPMICRQIIWNNKDCYDYYIFNENDHLIKEIHLDKFIQYTSILPQDKIAGLFQFELDDDQQYHYPAYHAHFDWDYNSVEEFGGLKFAHFTNVHQACFIITNQQLNMIGDKFQHPIGNSIYGIKERTNSDIYENCGMKKVICISEFYDNLVHHLPNLYVGGKSGRAKLGSNDVRMKYAITQLFENFINKTL